MQSLAIDFEANPFLLPEQQRIVERSESLVDNFTINEDGVHEFVANDGNAVEFGKMVVAHIHDQVSIQKTAKKNMPREIKTLDDLEITFQFKALIAVTRDQMLTVAGTLLALDMGLAFAREDESQIQRSTQTSAELVQTQAGLATQALLIADRFTIQPRGEEVSVWGQAKEAFVANPRSKPPVSIDDREGTRFDELAERMMDMTDMASSVDQPKASRFTVINLARAVRQSVRTVKQADGTSTAAVVHSILNSPMFPVTPIWNGKDTGDAHRIMRRKIRYFQAAARLDPELATDILVRNYVYLFDKLGGRDVSSVKQELQRDAKKVKNLAVKQIRKAENQTPIAENSDEDTE